MINSNKKNYKKYFDDDIFCNKNKFDYILIALNRFNENNYSYFPKELSDQSKNKIINYIFIAGICNNFELVKYIVRFYKLIGKEVINNYNSLQNLKKHPNWMLFLCLCLALSILSNALSFRAMREI